MIEQHGVRGFKFHPTVQGFLRYDRMAWPRHQVIAEYKLPAIFHSGHSGISSGMRCGGGLRHKPTGTRRRAAKQPSKTPAVFAHGGRWLTWRPLGDSNPCNHRERVVS